MSPLKVQINHTCLLALSLSLDAAAAASYSYSYSFPNSPLNKVLTPIVFAADQLTTEVMNQDFSLDISRVCCFK